MIGVRSNATIIYMTIAIIVFEFVVLLFSAMLHEVAHGYEAEQLGNNIRATRGATDAQSTQAPRPIPVVPDAARAVLYDGIFLCGHEAGAVQSKQT